MVAGALMLILLASLGVASRSQSPQASLGDEYATLLSTYARVPSDAVEDFVRWQRSDIERAILLLPRTSAGDILRAGGGGAQTLLKRMALLHLETAFAHYERNDGRAIGYHLEWSRRMVRHELPWQTLDHLRVPEISAQFVSDWTLTTAGFFHTKLAFAEARRFLDEELRYAPGNPLLLLARGMTEEIAVSERAMPRDETARPTGGNPTRVGIARHPLGNRRRATLFEAAQFYRAALAVAPSLHSARLRLGRVQFDLGHDADALQKFEETLTHAEDASTLYLTHLFLAAVQERNEREADAVRCFEAAAALFPSAQAPYLGLSRLALSHDPAAARRSLERMFARAVATVEGAVPDPWWLYDAGFGASLPDRLNRLRDEVRGR
jgi:hypothetical protein